MKINANHRLITSGNSAAPFIASPNVGSSFATGKPNYLIIHYTSGGTAEGAINWFKNPNAKASSHLVIGHQGDITQMVPFNKVAWHAGKSSFGGVIGLNNHAIGIEIANWGLLKGQAGHWRSWTGAQIPDERVLVAKHRNFEPNTLHGWEIYDQAQWDAVLAVSAALVNHYKIPEANVLGHEDIAPGRKQDPGPAFDLDRFRGRIYGRIDDEDDLFVVASSTGLNLRATASTQGAILKLLADKTKLRRMAVDGMWFQVTTLTAQGFEDLTGWVHSRWVQKF
jgi:N-acetylmuramoyl-L-alanine amidase